MSLTAWRLAQRNLLRNRRRSLTTGLAVVFGFVGLLLLGAYIFRSAMALRTATVYLNQKGHIAIRKKGALEGFAIRPKAFAMTLEDQARIDIALQAQSDDIEFSSKYLRGSGLLTDGTHSLPVIMTGLEPEVFEKSARHPSVAKWAPDWVVASTGIDPSEMTRNEKLISITSSIAAQLGRKLDRESLKTGNRDVQMIAQNYFRDLGAIDAELGPTHSTGVAFTDDTSVFIPIKRLQELLATDKIEYIAVFLKDFDRVPRVTAKLRSQLGADFELHTYSDEAWCQYYVGTMNFLYVMGAFFTLIILSAVSLTIVNTTTLNLLERTREIGTLRAIGFKPSHIQDLFFREATLLTAASVAAGTAVAIVIAAFVNSMNFRFQPPGTQGEIQFRLVINFAISAAMAIGVYLLVALSTRFVVRRGTRRKVVDLLADTGA